MQDAVFDDGHIPPSAIVKKWFSIVDEVFGTNKKTARPSAVGRDEEKLRPCIAVHCVAGLGRAPVLVALALIKRGKMPPLEAVRFVRKKRPKAFNQKQIDFLVKVSQGFGCSVM